MDHPEILEADLDDPLDVFSESFDAHRALMTVVRERERWKVTRRNGGAVTRNAQGRSGVVVVGGEWSASAAGLPPIKAQDTLDRCRVLLPRSDPNFRAPPDAKRRRASDQQESQQPAQPQSVERASKRARSAAQEGEKDSSQAHWEERINSIDEQRRAVVEKQIAAVRKKRADEPAPFERILERTCPTGAGPLHSLMTAVRSNGHVCAYVRGGRGVRSVLLGSLHAFDKHLNLVLGRVREHEYDPDQTDSIGRLRRSSPMLFVKGDTVVLIFTNKGGS